MLPVGLIQKSEIFNCRKWDVLEFINNDELLNGRLALKGGTAINLLEFDLPRLSVDIDLDYVVNADVEQMKSDREKINTRITRYMDQHGYSRGKSDRQSYILDSLYFSSQLLRKLG